MCLGLLGLLVVAVSLPPGYRIAFGQTEVRAWDAVLLANGLLYLVAAALIGVFRSRLGIGLGLILSMAGLTMTLAIGLSTVGYGLENVSRSRLLLYGGLAGLHAIVFAGAMTAADQWGIRPQVSRQAALTAAILAGLGLAISLGSWGGDFAIFMVRLAAADWFSEIRGWLPLPHFVAVAAIVLRGRLAMLLAAVVSAGGILVALGMLATLLISTSEPLHVLDSVALWLFFLVGYGIAAGAALRAWREESSEATV